MPVSGLKEVRFAEELEAVLHRPGSVSGLDVQELGSMMVRFLSPCLRAAACVDSSLQMLACHPQVGWPISDELDESE
jgi:hypothetical protein